MKARVEYIKVAPEAGRALYAVEKYVHQSGLETSLLLKKGEDFHDRGRCRQYFTGRPRTGCYL